MNYDNLVGKVVRKVSGEKFENGSENAKVKRLTVSEDNPDKDACMFYDTSEIVECELVGLA